MESDILAGDSEVCVETMSTLRAAHRVGGGQSLGKASLKRVIGTKARKDGRGQLGGQKEVKQGLEARKGKPGQGEGLTAEPGLRPSGKGEPRHTVHPAARETKGRQGHRGVLRNPGHS